MVRSQQERTTEEVHSCLHHGQQLFAREIVSFSSRVFLTEVCHHPVLVTLLMGQYSARGKLRRIHVQDESTLVNGQDQ